jgi:hypothetical protein
MQTVIVPFLFTFADFYNKHILHLKWKKTIKVKFLYTRINPVTSCSIILYWWQ